MGIFSVGDQVKIKPKSHYHGKYAGEFGEIIRQYDDTVAVKLDGRTNPRSQYGAYWFNENEVEFIESEEISIPLYRARKLEWHDPATEKAAS